MFPRSHLATGEQWRTVPRQQKLVISSVILGDKLHCPFLGLHVLDNGLNYKIKSDGLFELYLTIDLNWELILITTLSVFLPRLSLCSLILSPYPQPQSGSS